MIDTEWEEFGAKGELASILTAFDRDIDMHSVHVGKQIVDKLCGALYLGELVRGVMEQLVLDGVLFDGQAADSIQTIDAFPAKYISEILTDEETLNWKNTRRILDELEIRLHGSSDYLVLRELCHAVSQRSAAIAAAAIAALLRHLGRTNVVVGVGGVLVQFHPTYLALLQAKLDMLAPPNVQVTNPRAQVRRGGEEGGRVAVEGGDGGGRELTGSGPHRRHRLPAPVVIRVRRPALLGLPSHSSPCPAPVPSPPLQRHCRVALHPLSTSPPNRSPAVVSNEVSPSPAHPVLLRSPSTSLEALRV